MYENVRTCPEAIGCASRKAPPFNAALRLRAPSAASRPAANIKARSRAGTWKPAAREPCHPHYGLCSELLFGAVLWSGTHGLLASTGSRNHQAERSDPPGLGYVGNETSTSGSSFWHAFNGRPLVFSAPQVPPRRRRDNEGAPGAVAELGPETQRSRTNSSRTRPLGRPKPRKLKT